MKKPQPKTLRDKKIVQAAKDVHVLSRIAVCEYNDQQLAKEVKDMQKVMNEFFDLIVAECDKSIGHNFAEPFKKKLIELSHKYDQKPQEAKNGQQD